VRLSHDEVLLLKSSLEKLSTEASLYLFGSRVDDGKKGGDIDLLVVSKKLEKKDLRKLRLDFYEKFGEQKIDIILDNGNFEDPFVKLVFEKAIKL